MKAQLLTMNVDINQIDVVAPNLHLRYSGVTSTVMALLPLQAHRIQIASVGAHIPEDVPRVRMIDVILGGWQKTRVWHARRNDEMIVGLLLKYVLRQPWKLLFTSAAQRRHTAFTRWMIRKMDAIIATSEMAASYLERESEVIEHGVDLQRFQPAADRAAAWAATGLPGQYGVGVFGRVRAQKGTDLFVATMIRLLPLYPQWTAVITGLEAAEEADFVARLKKDIADAGLRDRILMLGEVARDEVPLWFGRVSLYVAPMRWEGFGLTTLEAMASGTAVVATRTGASPRIIRDGVTGDLIPADDLEALVAAVEPYLAQPDLAHQRGSVGRSTVEKHHDISQEVLNIEKVYEKLLGKTLARDAS
jgi:mannosyltransferase